MIHPDHRTDSVRAAHHEFTATGPNHLWLSAFTEHSTRENKLYACAIEDVFPNRIVDCSIDSRMKARTAVAALDNAVATSCPRPMGPGRIRADHAPNRAQAASVEPVTGSCSRPERGIARRRPSHPAA